jgi:LPXTG-site transpeptidase (sortase) family protein
MRTSGVLRRTAGVLAAGAIAATFLLPAGAEGARPAAGATARTVAATPRTTCPRKPSTPVRVSVPAIRVHATVLPISLHGSQLDPPSDWHQVGWWNQSTKPGLAFGKTVMTGHTTHWTQNGGVFNSLGSVKKGQDVLVNTANGCIVDYRVSSVKSLSHSQLSNQATSLFGQTSGGGNLVLITCAGWDGHEYHTNIVVTAKPLGWVL